MLSRAIEFVSAALAMPQRLLRGRLEQLPHPVSLSRADGKILWSNDRMRARLETAHENGSGGIEAVFKVDGGLIYRLASEARAKGFAFAPLQPRADGAPHILAVRFHEPDLLVWSSLPIDELGCAARTGCPALGPNAALAQLDARSRGDAAADPCFPQLRGDAPAPAAAPAGDAAARDPGTGASSTRSIVSAPTILEAVPVALMQFDLQGRLLWRNALAREMIGRDLPTGTALAEIVEPLGRPIGALVAEAAADPHGRREMVRLRSDAAEMFLQIVLRPVLFGSSPTLLAVLSDASELRLLEEKFAQSHKMEAIGKLAGGVAHDFNNVLTAISGHSDLLLLGKDALHPDYSDLMQIRQNTHRAAALVRQLLAFSRKQRLSLMLLSVPDVVSDSQYLLNRLIGEKVSLMVEHGQDLGPVLADQRQLEQALMNLVVNARDAMPDGGAVTIATRNLHIETTRPIAGVEIPAGDYVEISVSDGGPGIDPHIINRVFEPFFTTKPQGEGTGLGLSTVYGIVKQSGGFVFAENRPDGGARFRVVLPRASAADANRAPAPGAAESERRDLTGEGAVLLVEDEDPVRSFASRALKLRGYEVLEAASAEEAMEILTETDRPIDLLVSDVVMPGMDGPTFAAQARRLRPGLPIVFISGYAEDSFRRNLVDHDFLFLPKPFSLTDLTAKVKEALDARA